MKRLKRLLDCPEEDRGATLILVLFIVTVIGLAGAALLTFSDTSIRTTVALRDQAGNAYTADGAAQVAINNLSTGYGFTSPALFENATGSKCFGERGGTLDLEDFLPAANGRNGTTPSSASVVCTADRRTGVNATVVPITAGKNSPEQAILTMGETSEIGINVEGPSTNPFAVKGPVRSNSSIRVQSGTLQSTAAVTAVGACTGTGTIVSTPTKSCSLPANTVSDPGYPSDATEVPTYQPVPSDDLENCRDGVFKFRAGYYDDAQALTALMDEDSRGACAGSTWWFEKGTYYFDFHNNTNDSDVYQGSAIPPTKGRDANQWAITGGNLVAGTPTDSKGAVVASPEASPAIPGSCQSPIKSSKADGVQFIFGGDSQLALGGSAKAEICGTYHEDRPPIALYGVQSGTATTTALTDEESPDSSLKMDLPSAQKTGFTPLEEIVQQDDKSATWTKTSGTETSTIDVSGYSPPSAIPPGSIVKSAKVRVRHGNSEKYDDGEGKDKLTVTFTPKGVKGSQPGLAITPDGLNYPNNKKLKTDTLDIYDEGSSEFVRYVHANGFAGADMTYTATLSHAGTESLDAIQIDIEYVAPAFRSEVEIPSIRSRANNCMTRTYTRNSNNACAVLSTSTFARSEDPDESLPAFTGAVHIQGAIYTPVAAIDLTLNNATQPVLPFGVISRSLWGKVNTSISSPVPLIQIPDNAAGGDAAPVVHLTVYVCPATSTPSCSTAPGAIKALRVTARIDAHQPSKMTVLSWSNLR